MSSSNRARRLCSFASALNQATNMLWLIDIEMFISATFRGNTVGLPTRLMTGFAFSPSSKSSRPAGFSAGAQHPSARGLSFYRMAVSGYGRRGRPARARRPRLRSPIVRRSVNERWMAGDRAKRGRTNSAVDAIESQRKARAELAAQRQREADTLTGLKTEQVGQGPCGRGRGGSDHLRVAAPRR
jgi:hypothetical protein